MPQRSSLQAKPLTLRGVYEEPYRINGHRVLFSMDAQGEQVELRTVPPGPGQQAAVDLVTESLWATLDQKNPIPSDGVSRGALRLLHGGLASGLLALWGLSASLLPLAL